MKKIVIFQYNYFQNANRRCRRWSRDCDFHFQLQSTAGARGARRAIGKIAPGAHKGQVTGADYNALSRSSQLDGALGHWQDIYGHSECQRG